MNLLAHALLSPQNPAILTGNLAADWVKGRARTLLPPDIRAGMALHQRIDTFTDIHPLVDHCSNLLTPNWGRYAPVLVDIFFDHVLSCEWRHFSAIDRRDHIAAAYAALRQHHHCLPDRAQYAVCMLLADDWLSCYASIDGIALTLTRISARLQHGIELAPAVADFLTHQNAFRDAFHSFFPEIQRHVQTLPPPALPTPPTTAVH